MIEFRKYFVAPRRQVKAAVKWTNAQSLWRSSTRAINGFLQNFDFDFIVWHVGRQACNMSNVVRIGAHEYLQIIILLLRIRNRKSDVIKRKHFTADDIAWRMWIHIFRGERLQLLYDSDRNVEWWHPREMHVVRVQLYSYKFIL